VILAVPEQQTVHASGIGASGRTSVLTWWRWWCSACRLLAAGMWSHAELALRQGDRHAEAEQCHVVGQLALFGGAR
jgi:hypothetical protein